MKKYLILSSLLYLTSASSYASDTETRVLPTITEREATAIVEAEAANKERRKSEINAQIEAATVEEEFQHQRKNHKVVLRRVKPPLLQEENSISRDTASSIEDEPFTLERSTELSDHRSELITVTAKIFDDQYSKITFNDEGVQISIWTNIALNYLQSIGSFQFDAVHYNYFGFVDQIGSEAEEDRVNLWSEKGHAYQSRWEDPPVVFSDEPEYAFIAEDPALIPEKLYEQTTALLTYYLSEEENLRITYLNQKTMSAARAKYRAENPENPEDSVMLFWPEKNSRYLENTQ